MDFLNNHGETEHGRAEKDETETSKVCGIPVT